MLGSCLKQVSEMFICIKCQHFNFGKWAAHGNRSPYIVCVCSLPLDRVSLTPVQFGRAMSFFTEMEMSHIQAAELNCPKQLLHSGKIHQEHSAPAS